MPTPARHEFYLPNVDFGDADHCTDNAKQGVGYCMVRDRIEFCVGGQPWTFRKLVQVDVNCLAAEAAFAEFEKSGKTPPKLEFSSDAMLQTPADNLSAEAAAKMAEDICWLLQLALGQTVTWVLMRHQGIHDFPNVRVRGVRVATSVNRNRPLTNTADVKLQSYLEGAYPIFSRDPEWWRMTLDWFATVHDAKVIQVAGLLGFMLLERATTFVLKGENFPEQIEPGVNAKLKSGSTERAALVAEMDGLFKRHISPKWEGHRNEAIVSSIKGWNTAPPYKKKVEIAFARLGLPKPDAKMLDHRDRLAHRGELESHAENLTQYYAQISDAVISMLLRMLGYSGPYFVLGSGLVEKSPADAAS